MFIGNDDNASQEDVLKSRNITHVLNCAGGFYTPRDRREFSESMGVKYLEFQADDSYVYDMIQHVDAAVKFIDHAKHSNGVALVHCMMGINRSGFICAAYVMLSENVGVLEAVRRVKMKRPTVLCNDSFCRQLVQLARERGFLDHALNTDGSSQIS